jgi:hypothetical protein
MLIAGFTILLNGFINIRLKGLQVKLTWMNSKIFMENNGFYI